MDRFEGLVRRGPGGERRIWTREHGWKPVSESDTLGTDTLQDERELFNRTRNQAENAWEEIELDNFEIDTGVSESVLESSLDTGLSESTPLLGASAGAGAVGGSTGGSLATTAAVGGGILVGGAIVGGIAAGISKQDKTLPGHKYIGPGNELTGEEPVDEDDAIAKEHDEAYDKAQTQEDVRIADEIAIDKFDKDWQENSNIHSLAGKTGLQVKHTIEGITGVIYPSNLPGKEMGKYRWKFDPHNWPDQRINWNGMSRSQKAYTIKQYNKQRKSKGLNAVPNPFASGRQSAIFTNDDGTETITPRTVGRDPILDISGRAQAPRGHGPIIDAFQRQEQADEIAALDEFFASEEGRNFLDELVDINNKAELAQFAGKQAPSRRLPDPEVNQGASTSGINNKRPAEDQIEQPTKMVRTDESSRSRPSETPMEEGDAAAAGPAAGAGHTSRADGGFDSSQGPETYIPRGIYQHEGGWMKFKKVHHLKSYALPFTILTDDNVKIVTTPLAELRWTTPDFYMSKDEFNLIPAGSRFVKAKITIHNIVSSTQYPTGSTESTTATFNHPKIGLIGFDLEAKVRCGVNKKLSMSPQTEMLPISFGAATTEEFVLNQYGTDQSSATWDKDPIPGCMFPIPFNLYNYFCVEHPNQAKASSLGFTAANSPGYENFSSCITQFNLNDATWDKVFEREYTFQSAPVGTPYKALEIQGITHNSAVGHHVFTNIRREIKNTGPGGDVTITETIVPSVQSKVHVPGYNDTMEQGANLITGDSAHKPARQPSVHFGMKAIPKLSSLSNDVRASQFVHGENYFIVTAEILVKTGDYPNRFILPKAFNVPVEKALMGTGFKPTDNSQKVVTFGLENEKAV